MHFVEQKKQQNIEPPAELPPDLLPPSFRPNPAGMTDISTSTTCHETSLSAADSHLESGNKKIDEILDDIRNIQQEKRTFEQQLMQLEADMTIKNSEIRNLEVELNTLQATVIQLERQKGEAQRRLDDLDEQRNSLNDALNELVKRNEDDLQNINHLKSIIDNSDQVAKENERILNEKRTLLQTLTDEEMKLESKLQNDRRILQNLQHEQQDSEDFALKADDIVQQLRKQREFLMEKLEKLEQVVANGDQNYLVSNQDLMSMDDEFNLNK
uniref:Uncharacterized protein n=1 Tax=Romanomermis culicivorax TaxID=13658 RepID=A0A915ITU9_ROMCU